MMRVFAPDAVALWVLPAGVVGAGRFFQSTCFSPQGLDFQEVSEANEPGHDHANEMSLVDPVNEQAPISSGCPNCASLDQRGGECADCGFVFFKPSGFHHLVGVRLRGGGSDADADEGYYADTYSADQCPECECGGYTENGCMFCGHDDYYLKGDYAADAGGGGSDNEAAGVSDICPDCGYSPCECFWDGDEDDDDDHSCSNRWCLTCSGSGYVVPPTEANDFNYEYCEACNGTGVARGNCSRCDGTGFVASDHHPDDDFCPRCGGTGDEVVR